MSLTFPAIYISLQVCMVVALVWLIVETRRSNRKDETEVIEYTEPETGPIQVVSREPAKPPMCEGVTLYAWLTHHHPLKDNVWAAVVAEMYTRAAEVPEVASYFHRVLAVPGGLEKLQEHFTRMLAIITSTGPNRRLIDTLTEKHMNVRDEQGRPIDGAIWDAVISTLVGILVEQGVPAEGINNLTHTIEPLRKVIVRG